MQTDNPEAIEKDLGVFPIKLVVFPVEIVCDQSRPQSNAIAASNSGAISMLAVLLAFLLGVVAGLRTFTAPAAVSWAAYLGRLDLHGSWLAFLGFWLTPYIVTVAAVFEFVVDQLPSTPSRKMPMPFGARIASGALCGVAVAGAGGLLSGIVGAIIGTLGGAALRSRLAARLGSDHPAATIEDAVAIVVGVLTVACLP